MEDTNKNKEYQKFMDSVEAGNGVDWFKFIRKIWLIRKKICVAAGVGLILGFFVALGVPKQYTVAVSLAPEMDDTKMGGGLANMAASFFGGGTAPSGGDALNALLAPEILKSTPFLLELVDANVQSNAAGEPLTLATYLNSESKPWWNAIIGLPSKIMGSIRSLFTERSATSSKSEAAPTRIVSLTGDQISCLSSLRKDVTAIVDKKSSIIRINVTLQNPVVAAVLADSVVTKLQTYIVNYKSAKAKEDFQYWEKMFLENKAKYYEAQTAYASYTDAHSDVISQKSLMEGEKLKNEVSLAYQIFTQVAQQYQMARVKVQETKPVFTIIEPAVIPQMPSGVGRVFVHLLVIGITVIFYLLWVLLIKDLLCHVKRKLFLEPKKVSC